MKKSFPNFGNGNGRPVFPGMVGNGNSRSPLQGGAAGRWWVPVNDAPALFEAATGLSWLIVLGDQ